MEEKKITFKEHKEFGRLSKIFNDKLLFESVRIANEQKNKSLGKKKTIHYFKSIKALDKLRDNLEEIMFKDYPDKATTDIYYGKR